jgi:hypothetical protein
MTDESKVLVAMGAPDHPGGKPVIILGMTEAAWKALEGQKTHHFDFSSVGVHAQLIMFRGESHDDIKRTLAEAAGSLWDDSRKADGSMKDLGIQDPTKQ